MTRIKIIKNIAVLLGFIVSPAISNNWMEFARVNDHSTRFYISNRVYAAESSKQSLINGTNAKDIHVGHQISLFLSLESELWEMSQKVGDNIPESERITSTKFRHLSPGLFLQYAYHIPISKSFGFFLGTTAGVVLSTFKENNFNVGYSIFFPTISVGLTGSPVTDYKIALAFEYGASWYPDMYVVTVDNLQRRLGATLDMFNFYLENDYFFMTDIAVSVKLGMRLMSNACKLQALCSSGNYINTLRITNTPYYGQLGFVFGNLR